MGSTLPQVMIVGFSKHGLAIGGVSRAFKYLLAEEVSKKPVDYLLGNKNRVGVIRNPAPVVLRGDPAVAARLINKTPHRWKYTSGVLSFAPGETITPDMERRIMDEFETVAFAGLSEERYSIVFIRHAHLGREEMHFLVPRIELALGKSLNIAPPGRASRALFDAWRSKINAEYGLSDPDDPARRKSLSLPDYIAKLKGRPGQTRAAYSAAVRETITRFIETKAKDGLVKSRADVLRVLKQSGFTLPRAGKDYLTVCHPATGERFRLRGKWYGEELNGEATKASPDPAISPRPQLVEHFSRKLAPLREARTRYHLKRYGKTLLTHESIYDGTRTPLARCAQKIGNPISVPRSGVCQHAEKLERATRNFERAHDRLGRAHRAFARDYEAAVSQAKSRRQVKSVLRQYKRALNRDFAEDEMERELEP